jgi:hypothetical protein
VNRTRTRAAFGAAAVIATLLASGAGVSPALAATGDHGGSHAVHQAKGGGKHSKDSKDDRKLAKAVDKVDDALARQLRRAAKKLGDESAVVIAQNIATDRAGLSTLTTRSEVRALRPQNYQKVIGWVRAVEKRLAAQVDVPDPAVTDAAEAVLAELYTISASTGRTDVHEVGSQVHDFRALVDDDLDDEADESDEDEDQDEAEVDDESGEGGEGGGEAGV